MQSGLEKNSNKQWIYILKILACILITNSHCRNIYPVYFLAIGGGFGNAIFFMVSGYLLANINLKFYKWYGRRSARVMIPFLVFSVIDVMLGNGLHKPFYYIDKYWFVSAILIYYLFYYFLFKGNNDKKIKYGLFLWAIVYAVLYLTYVDLTTFSIELENFSAFKIYFYFGTMLVGGLMRRYELQISRRLQLIKNHNMIGWVMCLVSATVWVAEYGIISLYGCGFQVQFLIHVSVLVFSIGAILLIWRSIDINIPRWLKRVSDSTLEIYLLQVTIGYLIERLSFPCNWFVFFSVAFIGGVMAHGAIEIIEKGLKIR